jgi:hypothetical protein
VGAGVGEHPDRRVLQCERVTGGKATVTAARSEEDIGGLSLLPFRRVAALGVLAVAAALAACGDTSASTASFQSVTETTSPPSATSVVDDHADSANGATAVMIDEHVQGAVDYVDDYDVFVFETEEGRVYEIDVTLITLSDSYIEVYDADYSELAFNNDCGYYPGSCLVWEAPSSGIHYVGLGSFEDGDTGIYRLTITDGPTAVKIGEPVLGGVGHRDDYDDFVFEAEEGRVYEIDVTLPGLYLGVYDAEDSELAFNDFCRDSPEPCLVWKAPSSGSYYVEVSSAWDDIGLYTLTIDVSDVVDDHSGSPRWATAVTIGEAVQGAVDYWNDLDLFVFEAEEGRLYEIDVALGTLPDAIIKVYDADHDLLAYYDCEDSPVPCLVWKAPSSGSYYVEVGTWSVSGLYTLTLDVSDVVDDHSGSPNGATAVMVGEAVLGVVDYVDDYDVFVFEAEEGRLYEIDVALGTLPFSQLVVYDAGYSEPASSYDCGGFTASCVGWRAPSSGSYYVEVSAEDVSGSYTLTINVDDHPRSPNGATAVTVGKAVLGTVDYRGDFDLFVFEAEEGRLYEIDVALGTLSDSFVGLADPDADLLAFSYACGDSAGSCLVWEAPSFGSYYVGVGSVEDGSTGSYTLNIDVSDVVDDHSGSPNGATMVTVGEAVLGVVDYVDDYDVFVFETEKGRLYEIHVTLSDSFIEVRDADYSKLAYSYDYGDPPGSCLVWEAPSSGSYYVEISAWANTGSYTLTILTR